jgi:hypothetical protein
MLSGRRFQRWEPCRAPSARRLELELEALTAGVGAGARTRRTTSTATSESMSRSAVRVEARQPHRTQTAKTPYFQGTVCLSGLSGLKIEKEKNRSSRAIWSRAARKRGELSIQPRQPRRQTSGGNNCSFYVWVRLDVWAVGQTRHCLAPDGLRCWLRSERPNAPLDAQGALT